MNDLEPNPLVVTLVKRSAASPEVASAALAQTMRDLQRIGDAVATYRANTGKYPDTLWQLAASVLESVSPGIYDPWKTPYLFEISADGSRFFVVSAGSDRNFDRTRWGEAAAQLQDLKDDAVVVGDSNSVTLVRSW